MPTLLPTMNARCIHIPKSVFLAAAETALEARFVFVKSYLARGVPHSVDISFSVVERLHRAH